MATLYVMLVTVAHGLFPSADFPQVLGVNNTLRDKIAQRDDIEVVRETEADESDVSSPSASPKRLEAKQRFEKALEEAKKRREAAQARVKTRREEFKEKLETIKDERKQKAVENLDQKFSSINDKQVDHFNKVLSRLSQILAKIKDKGGETSEAEAAINEASEAVLVQAGNTYIIEIADEENLGENVSETVHNLRDDLKGVREKVRMAKEAVHEAFKSLRGV